MENKNVLMAVVLSTMVIIFTTYVGDEYVELENKQVQTEQTTKGEKPSAPSIVKKG